MNIDAKTLLRDAQFLSWANGLRDPYLHKGIRSIETGKIIAAGGFTNGLRVWAWAVDCVAEHFDCEPEEVDCDEHDQITVNGKPVATIETGRHVYRHQG